MSLTLHRCRDDGTFFVCHFGHFGKTYVTVEEAAQVFHQRGGKQLSEEEIGALKEGLVYFDYTGPGWCGTWVCLDALGGVNELIIKEVKAKAEQLAAQFSTVVLVPWDYQRIEAIKKWRPYWSGW